MGKELGTTIPRCKNSLHKPSEQKVFAQKNLGSTIPRNKLQLHVVLILQLVAWRGSAPTPVKNVSWPANPLTLSNCDSSHARIIAITRLQMPTQILRWFGLNRVSVANMHLMNSLYTSLKSMRYASEIWIGSVCWYGWRIFVSQMATSHDPKEQWRFQKHIS